jgi:hypothetical protein
MHSTKQVNKTVHATKNTMLASALASFGVPFVNEKAYNKVKYESGEVVVSWLFKTDGANGMSTSELIDAWYSDEWFEENYKNQHPWAMVICSLMTHKYLVAKIKDQPCKVKIKKKSKSWLVFEDSDLHKKLL